MRAAHGVQLTVEDAVIEAIAERCREVESGARNADHILRAAVMPVLSSKILAALAEEQDVPDLTLSLGDDGAIVCAP